MSTQSWQVVWFVVGTAAVIAVVLVALLMADPEPTRKHARRGWWHR